MKKYKEGVDFEWVKTKGSNAKSRKFFTKAEKAERAKPKAEKPKAKTSKASSKPKKQSKAYAVDVHDTKDRSSKSDDAKAARTRSYSKPKKPKNSDSRRESTGSLAVTRVGNNGTPAKNPTVAGASTGRRSTITLGKVKPIQVTPGPRTRTSSVSRRNR